MNQADAHNRRITDDQGRAYTYDKLLLATGGTPRWLPFGGDDIIYFRTFNDYQRLRKLTEKGHHREEVSTTCGMAEYAGSCCGTSGSRWTPPGS